MSPRYRGSCSHRLAKMSEASGLRAGPCGRGAESLGKAISVGKRVVKTGQREGRGGILGPAVEPAVRGAAALQERAGAPAALPRRE
ncbi:hypothetical protein AVXHC19_16110 [Acidovorax sacchari]